MILYDKLFRIFNQSVARKWAVFLTLCLTLFVINREIISNGFSVLSGDRYDAVISTSLLEHWHNVFCGHARWSDAFYFYPYTRTIAHTDAYFIIGIAYVPFRFLGFDPFLSAEFAGIVIKAIGFVGMYVFMRKILRVSFGGALLAAVLFSLSNAMTSHSSRLQLATVAFAPVESLLIGLSWEAMKRGAYRMMCVYASLACILMGAWCITCFYMAWFFFYLFIVFAFCVIVFNFRKTWVIMYTLYQNASSCLFVIFGVACVSIAPFAYAFLPKSREVGVRHYATVFENTVNPKEIFQTGEGNLFLGPLYCKFLRMMNPDYVPTGEYYNTGVSLPLFALFVMAIVFIKRKKYDEVETRLKCLSGAALITWFSVLRFGNFSFWYFIFYGFPGAKALNSVQVYQILLAFPIVAMACACWGRIKNSFLITFALPVLLIFSELNHPYLNLNRIKELAKIEVDALPPSDCTAFYVGGWSWQKPDLEGVDNLYAHNVTAMMIAQELHLPTLNGFASFNPPDWCFGNPNGADYDFRVRNYARRHEVLDGLYKFDLNKKTWTPVFNAPLQLKLMERITPDLDGYFCSGWSYSEHSHRWTSGAASVLRFCLIPADIRTLRLNISGYSLGKQHAEIRLNGLRIWSGEIPSSGFPVIIPAAKIWKAGLNRLEFFWPDCHLPGNGDARCLAFAFQGLTVTPMPKNPE